MSKLPALTSEPFDALDDAYIMRNAQGWYVGLITLLGGGTWGAMRFEPQRLTHTTLGVDYADADAATGALQRALSGNSGDAD